MTTDPRSAPHDSETTAALYLGGELGAKEHTAFEEHLPSCEPCWREIELGRTGRRLAESARDVAPAELRERLRSVIADAPRTLTAPPATPATEDDLARRRLRPSRVLAILATAAVLIVGVSLVTLPTRAPAEQPPAIALAVAGFRSQQLPGNQLPSGQAPDLQSLDLRQVGAASGSVAGTMVTAFAYRDSIGRDLVVYLSDEPFPTAVGADLLSGPDGPWVAQSEGITVLCARSPHALLVLGADRRLVMATAEVLQVT